MFKTKIGLIISKIKELFLDNFNLNHILAMILLIFTILTRVYFPDLIKNMLLIWFFFIFIWIYKNPYSSKNTFIKFILFIFLLTNFLPFISSWSINYSFIIFVLGQLLVFYFILTGNFKSKIKPSLTKFDYVFLLVVLFSIWIIFFSFSNTNDISVSTINSTSLFLKGTNPYEVEELTEIHQQHFMYGPMVLYYYAPFVFIFGSIFGLIVASLVSIVLLLYGLYKIIFIITKDKQLSRSGVIIFSFFPITFFELFLNLTNDSAMIFFFLFGVLFVLEKSYLKSIVFLTFGLTMKLAPIISVFLLIVGVVKKKKTKFVNVLVVFILLLFVLVSPFVFSNFGEFSRDLSHQATRDLEGWEKSISLQEIFLGFNSLLIQLIFILIFVVFIVLKFNYVLEKKQFILLTTLGLLIFNLFIRTYHQNYFIWLFVFMVICLMIIEKQNFENKAISEFKKISFLKLKKLFKGENLD